MPSEKTSDPIEKGTLEVNGQVSGTAGYLGSPGTPRTHRALSAQLCALQKTLKEGFATHRAWWLKISRFFQKLKLIYGPFLLFSPEPHKH